MHSTVFLAPIIATSLVAASPSFEIRHAPCGESSSRICHGVDGGESQHLSIDDIQYVAGYLRFISEGNEGAAKFWTMPEAKDCAEWTLPVPGAGTVLALAKHIDPGIKSSILYQDLARAIDGGQDATEPEMNKSLLGCGTHGGQYGVIANLSDPLYHTDEYKDSGAKPEGILVKLVNAPAQVLGQQTGEL